VTEPRTPDTGQSQPSGTDPVGSKRPNQAPNQTPTGPSPGQDAIADRPTPAGPSLNPSSETGPSAAPWSIPTRLGSDEADLDAPPSGSPPGSAEPSVGPSSDPAVAAEPGSDASPYEPADRLPDTRLGVVGDGESGGPDGAPVRAVPARSRSGLRWGLAIAGIAVVIGASALIVSLAGGRPSPAAALGYMPTTLGQYTEVRLDLPGDQRQKLAAFLASFPGFKDQTQVEPKLNDVLDRILRLASGGKQTYTTDIAPWFDGQVAVGASVPDPASGPAMSGVANTLIVLSIKDEAKAEAWLSSTAPAPLTKEPYNGADLWTEGAPDRLKAAVGFTDKAMIVGDVDGVRAAIDTKGQGQLASDPDFKAAFAQVDRDYVVMTFMKTRPYVDSVLKMIAKAQPGMLEGSQIDETVEGLIPAWQVSTGRFENDAFVGSVAYPSSPVGYDAHDRRSELLGHVPPKTILYWETHDVGPVLGTVIGKFRALPEMKGAFGQFDQALSLLGGFDAAMGWWGDVALAVTPGADGTIGGGLLIQPRDKAAADHLITTLRGYLALAGGGAGLNVRDEDHGGTKITVVDFSAAPGMKAGSLPKGYKAEFAIAVGDGVVVLGYGRVFVASVLDAGPGTGLAEDERFTKLLGRVGEENLGTAFADLEAIRGLFEPLVQQMAPPEAWSTYQTDVRPYLEHIDAMISAIRRDGALDRGSSQLTLR
jgi:hypothetical protein